MPPVYAYSLPDALVSGTLVDLVAWGMRDKQHLVEDEEDEDEEEDGEDFLNMKPRVTSPLDGGGGFWMAAVSAAAGGGMDSGLLAGPQAETGFISSQPSMAEFILPHHLEMGGGDPMSPQQYPPGLVEQGVNVQEYPWMKEKKTTRKNSQQGRLSLFYSAYCIVSTYTRVRRIYLKSGSTKYNV